jgi:hypothetical protein
VVEPAAQPAALASVRCPGRVQVGGLSVEAAHIEGLAQFIRKSDLYGFDLPQAVEGFLQIFNAMTHWWTQLAYRARDLN